jgi:hypothetical protein
LRHILRTVTASPETGAKSCIRGNAVFENSNDDKQLSKFLYTGSPRKQSNTTLTIGHRIAETMAEDYLPGMAALQLNSTDSGVLPKWTNDGVSGSRRVLIPMMLSGSLLLAEVLLGAANVGRDVTATRNCAMAITHSSSALDACRWARQLPRLPSRNHRGLGIWPAFAG